MKDKMVKIGNEERYVMGKASLTYGQRRRYKNLQAPKRMQYKGEEVIAELDFNEENDPYLYLLEKLVTEWSKDEKVNRNSIANDYELGDLFDEFVEKVQKFNNLIEDDDEEEEEESKN